MKTAPPTIMAASAAGGRKFFRPTAVSPNASPPMPMPASTTPTASNGSWISARMFSM